MFKKIKENMANISFARNSYSAMTGVVVIAIVLILNLMLQQLVGTSGSIDISDTEIYDMTDITVELLEGLDTEISFTIIAEDAAVSDLVKNYIDKYTAMTDMISVEWIDPVLNPTSLETYNTTSSTIVIECEETGKSTIVSISDIYYLDEMSYYYYGTYTYYFDGEGLFTSAISQVTSTTEQKMYTVTGHGESTMSDSIYELLTKSSVTTEELNLLTTTEIPEDCDLLAIIAPTTDITDDEKTLLADYLASGGNVLIMLGSSTEEAPNLEALLYDYGLDVADGYIADQERAYQGNGYYIIPSLSVSGDLATDITTESVLIINTRGFEEVTPSSDTISVNSFMTTSDYGLSISEDAEVSGTYVLAAVATDTITLDDGTESEAMLTVYGSMNIISEDVTSAFATLENTTLFMNSVMANFEGSTNVSIDSIAIEDSYNVVENTYGYSLIFIVIIPVGILIAGFIVWNDRRKR